LYQRNYNMGVKSRKYMRRQNLEILAGHTMWGGLWPPITTWPASIFRLYLRMYFLFLPHIVFYFIFLIGFSAVCFISFSVAVTMIQMIMSLYSPGLEWGHISR